MTGAGELARAFEAHHCRIVALDVMRNPDMLTAVPG